MYACYIDFDKTFNKVNAFIRWGIGQVSIPFTQVISHYSEAIFNETLEEEEIGINIDGLVVGDMSYVDHTVHLTSNLIDMQYI